MEKIRQTKLFKEALSIAKKVLAGNISPNKGCELIGDINRALDWPEELSGFGLIAHEQYDHEHLGITAENCIPEILEECKKLISLAK